MRNEKLLILVGAIAFIVGNPKEFLGNWVVLTITWLLGTVFLLSMTAANAGMKKTTEILQQLDISRSVFWIFICCIILGLGCAIAISINNLREN